MTNGFKVPEVKEFGGEIRSAGDSDRISSRRELQSRRARERKRQLQLTQAKEFGGDIKSAGGGFQVPQVKEFGGEIREAENVRLPVLERELTDPSLQPEIRADFQQRNIFGKVVDENGPSFVNKAIDFVTALGGGPNNPNAFATGLDQLTSLNIPTADPALITPAGVSLNAILARALKTNTIGKVNKESLANGGVKTSRTIQKNLVKRFKPSRPYGKIGTMIFVGTVLWEIKEAIKEGGEAFALGKRDILEEAGGGTQILMRDMLVAGDMEGYEEAKQAWKDIQNTSISFLPWGVGGTKNAETYARIMNNLNAIRDRHIARTEKIEVETGTNEQQDTASFWKAYHDDVAREEEESSKRQVDYFNSQQAIAREQERIARRQDREDSAKFWIDYRKQLIEMEKRAREEAAKFWLEYRKEVIRLQAHSASNQRSNLNFGLL